MPKLGASGRLVVKLSVTRPNSLSDIGQVTFKRFQSARISDTASGRILGNIDWYILWVCSQCGPNPAARRVNNPIEHLSFWLKESHSVLLFLPI
jgi:hypothetical protein